MRGVHTWQRDLVGAAAFGSFGDWMTTFPDSALLRLAQLCYSLASAGCDWLPKEAERVMQVGPTVVSGSSRRFLLVNFGLQEAPDRTNRGFLLFFKVFSYTHPALWTKNDATKSAAVCSDILRLPHVCTASSRPSLGVQLYPENVDNFSVSSTPSRSNWGRAVLSRP